MPKEKYLILRERRDMLNPAYWMFISHTSPINKKLYGINLKLGWIIYKEGTVKGIFKKDDWERVENYITRKIFIDKNYLIRVKRKVETETFKVKNLLQEIAQINFSSLSFKNLINLTNKIQKSWLHYNATISYAFFLSDKFNEIIKKSFNLPLEEFLILTTPEEKTAVNQLKFELLKYAKSVKMKKLTLVKASEYLSWGYGWIPFGYDGPQYWDKNYFIKMLEGKIKISSAKIDEEIKKIRQENEIIFQKKQVIFKKYKISKAHLKLVDKMNLITVWTDKRKRWEFSLHYYYNKILEELEKRYNIPHKNIKYLFTEELPLIEGHKKELLRRSEDRIKNQFIVEYGNDKYKILSKGKKKNEILKFIEKTIIPVDIEGLVASRGDKNVYRGTVKILFSPQDGNKIKNNDFLVATMTNPQYVMAMKKAIGFITDEGGVTCHAAIIAREMGKPCIIGTKIATKVLKDGDLVEVDATHGKVIIIKRSQK